jgi:BirA family biotin operon repressor/biotin-[acetyl-CoA-carboxylase] ligase
VPALTTPPSRAYRPPLALDLDVVVRDMDWAVEQELIETGVAQRTRILARLLRGERVSGQDLAGTLGVSRAAVNKHVQLLRAQGMDIESVPGSGYLLASMTDTLVPEAVLPVLLGAGLYPPGSDCYLGLPYRFEPEVPSTNLVAKEMAQEGVPGGAFMVTEHQTSGRGRLDRTWLSEGGKDLTFSVLLRPELASGEVGAMVLAAAVAVSEVLSALPGMEGRVKIKWPNDLLVDGRKVAGILAEAAMDIDTIYWLVIGIGLNVNGDAGRLVPRESLAPGQPPPVSLAELTGTSIHRVALLAKLSAELSRRWCQVIGGQRSAVLDAFAERDALLGRHVVVRSGLRREQLLAEGVAQGLGSSGELLLRQKDGKVVSVSSGEATLARDGR